VSGEVADGAKSLRGAQAMGKKGVTPCPGESKPPGVKQCGKPPLKNGEKGSQKKKDRAIFVGKDVISPGGKKGGVLKNRAVMIKKVPGLGRKCPLGKKKRVPGQFRERRRMKKM